MKWAKESNQDTALLLLDFEKAYDKIEWTFKDMMIESFRFSIKLCNMVKVLMKYANAYV